MRVFMAIRLPDRTHVPRTGDVHDRLCPIEVREGCRAIGAFAQQLLGASQEVVWLGPRRWPTLLIGPPAELDMPDGEDI